MRRKLDFSRWRLPGRQWHKALPAAALGLAAFWLGQQLSALLAPSAPSYRDLAPAQPQAAAAAAAQGHWFGEAPQQPVAALPPVRLLGVYAPSRDGVQGFAIIDSNGHPEPLLQGKQTPDGWELVKVAPNGVTLRSGGNEQFVPLQRQSGGGGDMQQSAPSQPPAMQPAQPMPGAIPIPIPGQNAVPDAQPQPAVDPAAMIRQ